MLGVSRTVVLVVSTSMLCAVRARPAGTKPLPWAYRGWAVVATSSPRSVVIRRVSTSRWVNVAVAGRPVSGSVEATRSTRRPNPAGSLR